MTPVALLIGPGTQAATELLVVTFSGRADLRTFGEPTFGYPPRVTANRDERGNKAFLNFDLPREVNMDFRDVVLKRRMVRNFSDAPIDPDVLDRILALARHAPSAGFTQGQSFIVVTRQEIKNQIAELCGEQEYVAEGFDAFISKAPVLLIPCTSEAAYRRRYHEPDKIDAEDDGADLGWPVPYWHMDLGCAVMVVLLAAVNEGLAAGFSGVWDVPALRTLLRIPEEVMPAGVIPIGYPAPDKLSSSLKRGRKPENEYVHRERWVESSLPK